MKNNILFLVVGIVLIVFFVEGIFAQIIPGDRRIDWSDAGVDGGIPERTTICITLNPTGDTTDRASDIRNAISGCPSGQVVYMNAGDYYLDDNTGNIVFKDGVTLRGAGIGNTNIITVLGFSSAWMFYLSGGGDFGYGSYTFKNVGAIGRTKGSNQIYVANHGWSANNYLIIDQANNASADPPISNSGKRQADGDCGRGGGGRCLAQMTKIISVINSNEVRIDPPLAYDFDGTTQAGEVPASSMIEYAGIEDLTINSMTRGGNGNIVNNIFFGYAANSWAKNIEIHGLVGRGIWIYDGMRNTIQGSKIWEQSSHLGGYETNGEYGIFLGPHASFNLIENNILKLFSLGISVENSPTGNVIAYNYMREGQYSTRVNIGLHGPHPMMNLIEGNYIDSGYIYIDDFFGTNSHTTIFRNRVWPADIYALIGFWNGVGISLHSLTEYDNVIGNVVGDNANIDDYEFYNEAYGGGNIAAFRTGYEYQSSDFTGGNTETFTTMLRHKNFDYFTDSVKNCGDSGEPPCQGISPSETPPNSLYLGASAPSWWCQETPWPAIGPDVAGYTNDIPAKRRYESSICTLGAPTSCSFADTNTDNIVDITEIMNYISNWKSGSVDITELMTGITEWKNGC